MFGLKNKEEAYIKEKISETHDIDMLNIEATALAELTDQQCTALYNVLKLISEKNITGSCSVGWIDLELQDGQIKKVNLLKA